MCCAFIRTLHSQLIAKSMKLSAGADRVNLIGTVPSPEKNLADSRRSLHILSCIVGAGRRERNQESDSGGVRKENNEWARSGRRIGQGGTRHGNVDSPRSLSSSRAGLGS